MISIFFTVYSRTASRRKLDSKRTHGRIAPGSVYQCYHGAKLVPQTILEWQPFERMIVKELSPMFPSTSAISEYRLDSTEEGTRLTKIMAHPTGPFLGRTLIRLLMPVFIRLVNRAFEAFKLEIEKDFRSQTIGRDYFQLRKQSIK